MTARHPSYTPTCACEALACNFRAHRIEVCRSRRCPHTWQRESSEDRAARDRKDAAGAAEGALPHPERRNSRNAGTWNE